MRNPCCKNCGAILYPEDLSKGECDRCGRPVPSYLREDKDRDHWRDHSRNYRQERRGIKPGPIIAIVVGVLAVGAFILYTAFHESVEIHVDNTGQSPLKVFIDDDLKTTVEAGQFKKVSCRSGEKTIRIERENGEKLFVAQKTLVPKRKYLLNPGGDGFYFTHTVQYQDPKIPVIQRIIADDENGNKELADEIRLQPQAEWIDVNPDFVLERVPKEVMIYSGTSVTKTRIARISKTDRDLVITASAKKKLSEADANRLATLVERLQD